LSLWDGVLEKMDVRKAYALRTTIFSEFFVTG
jgi:hypothetical protein